MPLTKNHRKAGACSDIIARGPATTKQLAMHLQELKSLKETGMKRKKESEHHGITVLSTLP